MLEKRLVFIDLQAPGANSHPAPAASSRSVPAEGQGQTPVASLPHAASHFASVAPHSEVVARHPEPMAIWNVEQLVNITIWLVNGKDYPIYYRKKCSKPPTSHCWLHSPNLQHCMVSLVSHHFPHTAYGGFHKWIPNSWQFFSMGNNGKSYQNGWFRDTQISGNLHILNHQFGTCRDCGDRGRTGATAQAVRPGTIWSLSAPGLIDLESAVGCFFPPGVWMFFCQWVILRNKT